MCLVIPTVSGGFAVVQPNSALSINAVEAYPLEDFSAESVRAQISEAQKVANGSGSEQDIAEAKIELEVSPLCLQNWQPSSGEQSQLTSSTGSGDPAGFPEVDGLIFHAPL